jgi:hypothetical protein
MSISEAELRRTYRNPAGIPPDERQRRKDDFTYVLTYLLRFLHMTTHGQYMNTYM